MANRHERRAGKAQQRRPRHPTAPHLAVVPNLLNNEWDTFREMVLAPDAPDIQLSEIRRAFFGGDAALFKEMMRKLDQGEEAKERDEAQLDSRSEDRRLGQARVSKCRTRCARDKYKKNNCIQ